MAVAGLVINAFKVKMSQPSQLGKAMWRRVISICCPKKS
jgi:hypothetical protein